VEKEKWGLDVRVWDAGPEHGHPSDVRATTGREDVADGDVVDQLRVDARSVKRRLEDGEEEILGQSILETTLSGLGGSSRVERASEEEVRPTARGGARERGKGKRRTRVMGVRTAETMTTSLSFCLRRACLPMALAVVCVRGCVCVYLCVCV
jgi:hypothetical protein